METYERSTRVDAPFEDVWAFHATERGLLGLTPDWLHMQIGSVHGPDGTPDPDVLEEGSVLRVSVRPVGVGPRQEWVSEIVARERSGGSAYFRDVMREGPFREWTHTHLFYADGSETVARDVVEYELPLGTVGKRLGPLAVLGLEPMFRYRHRQLRRRLR